MSALGILFRGIRRWETVCHPALSRSLRGEPPEKAKSLEQKLKELNAFDPEVEARVDIGLYKPPTESNRKERLKVWKANRNSFALAEDSRSGALKISYQEVKNEWRNSLAHNALREIAEHYGIFTDLYEYGYFNPIVPLDIYYDYDDEHFTPVHSGNIILPSEATKVPVVHFESEPETLWTLVLTSLDGHLLEHEMEYLHWFVGNIKGGDMANADVLCSYLQPFHPKGTGYHRYVFVLYKQEGHLDYTDVRLPTNCTSLKQRTFKTYDFYKKYEDKITPAGLAFFQSVWDDSLMDFFHHTLKMKVPVFDYAHTPEYIPPQVKYPHKEAFNLYLDKYRDPRDIRQEVFLKRLKTLHPFQQEKPMPKYPNIYKIPRGTPSWLVDEMRKERFRIGKYRDLQPFSLYPVAEYEKPEEKALREQEELKRKWQEKKATARKSSRERPT
ncbi:large ribosomal subunit protein mL38-like [Ornithodoros turicata]|uniref:large ribosomal subunit protein mL38-like n=1 Tax=Ornithodoros turicata TaxID=34597 RepID=UPI003139CC7E